MKVRAMVTTDWSDLNRDGKRLESLIKEMRKKSKKDGIENSLYFAFIDRIIKATNSKVKIAEIVLNVNAVLRDAQKATIKLTV